MVDETMEGGRRSTGEGVLVSLVLASLNCMWELSSWFEVLALGTLVPQWVMSSMQGKVCVCSVKLVDALTAAGLVRHHISGWGQPGKMTGENIER